MFYPNGQKKNSITIFLHKHQVFYFHFFSPKIWFIFRLLNMTFNNISVMWWRSVLLMEVTGVPGKNHWPVTNHWQTFITYCWIEYSSPWARFQLTTLVVIGTPRPKICTLPLSLLFLNDPYLDEFGPWPPSVLFLCLPLFRCSIKLSSNIVWKLHRQHLNISPSL